MYCPLVRKVKSKHVVTDSPEGFLHFFHVLLATLVAAKCNRAWVKGQCSLRHVFQTSETCFRELMPVVYGQLPSFGTFLYHRLCFQWKENLNHGFVVWSKYALPVKAMLTHICILCLLRIWHLLCKIGRHLNSIIMCWFSEQVLIPTRWTCPVQAGDDLWGFLI